jgi:hypothetical protein
MVAGLFKGNAMLFKIGNGFHNVPCEHIYVYTLTTLSSQACGGWNDPVGVGRGNG